MHRTFLSAVAILSIVLTGFAPAPARAADDDVARTLAVILGLAVLGAAIAHDDDRDRDRVTRYDNYRPRPGIAPRPLPHRVQRKVLPQECLRSFRTRDGRARMFTKRCLERNYRYTKSLPRDCRVRVKTDRGTRHGYGARCLNRRGYTIARR